MEEEQKEKKFRINWVKIDRFSAWVLLICMFAYFISGYGMTKDIIDSAKAAKLHNDVLPLIIIISFVIHASYATRLAFMRWRWWNIIVKTIWAIIFLTTLFGLIYLDSFYERPITQNSNIKIENQTETQVVDNDGNNVDVEDNVFTLEELKKYNGQDGYPPYAAVDDVVYDMSDIFEDGEHYKHIAGEELSDEFYSKHISEEITKYPVVGKLIVK